MSFLIGADIVPTSTNSDLFAKGDVSALVGKELQKVLSDADYRAFNLETPLTDLCTPIEKCGPALRADCLTVAGIKKIGVDLLTLANNHIMDQGENGLISTIETLEKHNISYLGAGKDLIVAKRPLIAYINGKKVGFYGCVEHEFSIAGEISSGANPFDPLESFDHVAELRKTCDYVVVLYHGGKEHYQYPSPMLQRVCRKFVEKGANLIVCQHSHCIGCEEKYKGGTIVYGQGNFIFDSGRGPYSNTSLLIKINDDFSIEYIPLVKAEKGARLAAGEDAKKILSEFSCRSEQIKQNGFVEKEYHKFAKKMLDHYLLTCYGYRHKFLCRILNKLCGGRLSRVFVNSYKREELLAIRNYIECEAHRELMIEGLKVGAK